MKTGIQDRENETWIPASAGMTTFWNMFYFYFQSAKLIPFWKVWQDWRKEILIIAILQNVAYLLILIVMQWSKVSYVVAFRQVGALFGTGMGIIFLKENHWKTRITGALILTLGLVLIGLAK